ncbi:MAG: transposase [Candidatus Eisenbacteria bacterium]
MAKRTRKRYTDEQKKTILAAAQAEGLTALQVQKKFGVKPITYYSWRKKGGGAKRGGRKAGRGPGRPPGPGKALAGGLASVVRGEVQNRVRAMLPEIVRAEVNSFLDALLGSSNGRRGRKKK